jgi:hypothetical protein
MGVMNDVILMIEFPKFTIFNFYLIAFGGVLNSTDFGYSFEFIVKLLIKSRKMFDIYSHFERLRVFHF